MVETLTESIANILETNYLDTQSLNLSEMNSISTEETFDNSSHALIHGWWTDGMKGFIIRPFDNYVGKDFGINYLQPSTSGRDRITDTLLINDFDRNLVWKIEDFNQDNKPDSISCYLTDDKGITTGDSILWCASDYDGIIDMMATERFQHKFLNPWKRFHTEMMDINDDNIPDIISHGEYDTNDPKEKPDNAIKNDQYWNYEWESVNYYDLEQNIFGYEWPSIDIEYQITSFEDLIKNLQDDMS